MKTSTKLFAAVLITLVTLQFSPVRATGISSKNYNDYGGYPGLGSNPNGKNSESSPSYNDGGDYGGYPGLGSSPDGKNHGQHLPINNGLVFLLVAGALGGVVVLKKKQQQAV